MSGIIKSEAVIDGLRCCLETNDCLHCPYAKVNGKKCRTRLYQDAVRVIIANRKRCDAYDALLFAERSL